MHWDLNCHAQGLLKFDAFLVFLFCRRVHCSFDYKSPNCVRICIRASRLLSGGAATPRPQAHIVKLTLICEDMRSKFMRFWVTRRLQ
ncbi:hypothetical protein C8R47DRAFT_1086198 [Mycena vitilis]|nr:hypothetical protein C8R47DRAFT_1086198 [Mycena vitilis]